MDNAIRYSPPAANVKLAVRREGEHVRLSVDDSGPGLSAADMQRLGERFFRVLGTGEAGSGLGWSIVQRIAKAHGAAVRTSTSSLGGLASRVEFAAA